MKKIYLFLALAVGLLASCDMDKTQIGRASCRERVLIEV